MAYTSIQQRVEDFIQAHELDERAADALSSCAPEVQQKVLDRGDLREVRNPSSAVLGRIRQAQSGVMTIRPGGAVMGGPDLQDALEDFISKFDLDERASGALREVPEAVQQAVIDRGDLTDVRNPSSAVIGRIRDAQNGTPSGGKGGSWYGAGPYGWDGGWGGCGGGSFPWSPAAPRRSEPAGMRPGEVEEFIRSNELDDRAADALRSCTTHVQRVVVDRGDVRSTRNPSSAVLGRIRDAQSSRPTSGGKGGDGWGAPPWASAGWKGGYGRW